MLVDEVSLGFLTTVTTAASTSTAVTSSPATSASSGSLGGSGKDDPVAGGAGAGAAASADADNPVWGMPMFENNSLANLTDAEYLAMVIILIILVQKLVLALAEVGYSVLFYASIN